VVASGYEPVTIPAWAWHRADTRAILAARDVGALFRFVSHYGGASQSRIATACGLSQGRVNEVINGRREMTRLDVLTRIADGLGMPDESRTEFGLAPRHADRERVHVYPSQESIVDEVRRAAQSASKSTFSPCAGSASSG
jgi:transcriptional regulator with XRE-family HTH domain